MYQIFKNKYEYEEDVNIEFDPIKSAKIYFKKIIGYKDNIIIYLFTILITRMGLSSGVNPFGMSMLAATSDMNIPLLIPFAIIAAVNLISFGPMALIKYIIGAIIYAILKSFLKDSNTKVGNISKLIFSTAIAEIIILTISGTLLYDALLAVYSCVTTAIFYVIFSEGIPVITEFKNKKIFSSESLMAAGILIAIAISGIGNISIFNISIRGVVSVLTVLLLGWKRGASVGAASGIAISIVLGLMGVGSAAIIAAYGFSGLLAGIFSKFGKWGAALGFIVGNIILAFHANGSTEVLISIKEIVVASVCLFLVPKKVSVMLDDLFDYNNTLPEGVKGYIEEETIYKLNAVSEVVDNMAQNVIENIETEDITVDEVGVFIKTLNDNTCRRCENYDKCWKQNYHNMYATIFNAIETLQVKNEIKEIDLDESICENRELLVDGLNFCYQIYKVNQNWQQKMKEKRIQVSKQLKGVSEAINKLTEEIEDKVKVTYDNMKMTDKYNLQVGIAKTKKNKSKISGDNTIFVKLNDGKYLIGISDGMGSGEKAERNSKKVIELLQKLLNTGFDRDAAIKLVNSVMLLGEDEDMFATLDIFIFDPIDGKGEFLKVSACPTYVKKEKKVDMVRSITLPVRNIR